ncbi:hypothetical protein [Paenibacillus radicis (ex Gao et al. 2016)]|uniref:Uncharacterized protein n=1 Tax=Paenibacillus radicis (ex Gao et al. 2016) TaxID=1737354 RepID=A0A917HKG2_9BACL|nr:hypothetical protein [Paenibacillus radicis (ex Gao et al. 2016)]GGG81557.1 hypothetical protein GCM10010918_43550 [Paenibacillus radicis (ex Gao et al. 2016)]
MKKMLLQLMLLIIVFATACSANNSPEGASVPPASPTPTGQPPVTTPTPELQPATAEQTAKAIITALKNKDHQTLVSYIHPDKGVLFSPYAHIDVTSAEVFKADKLPQHDDSTVYYWGDYDGSGEAISLTYGRYYDKFVYDQDFAAAEKVSTDSIVGKGNSLLNISEVFPGSTTVEYHFSGFDPQYEGMDWESLILVLEKDGSVWHLSAIVHSSWTI